MPEILWVGTVPTGKSNGNVLVLRKVPCFYTSIILQYILELCTAVVFFQTFQRMLYVCCRVKDVESRKQNKLCVCMILLCGIRYDLTYVLTPTIVSMIRIQVQQQL